MSPMRLALLGYLSGVLAGVWRTDGPAGIRLLMALLWPIGPLAFAVTMSILLAASLVAFPRLGAGVALAAAVLWWLAG